MSVSAADLAELKRMEAATEVDATAMAALPTTASVFAFIAASAKVDGDDEGDAVELLARFSGMTASETSDIAGVLKALGYRSAADRLRQIAGRRRVDLRPLA